MKLINAEFKQISDMDIGEYGFITTHALIPGGKSVNVCYIAHNIHMSGFCDIRIEKVGNDLYRIHLPLRMYSFVAGEGFSPVYKGDSYE